MGFGKVFDVMLLPHRGCWVLWDRSKIGMTGGEKVHIMMTSGIECS